MNPNAYFLPQKCPPDRAYARALTLRWQQEEPASGASDPLRPGWLTFARDQPLSPTRFEVPFRPLPGFAKPLEPTRKSPLGGEKRLHPQYDFTPAKKARLLLLRYRKRFNENIVRSLSARGAGEASFERFYRLMREPDFVRSRWDTDVEFARQRLTGVNPMCIRRHRAREAPVPAVDLRGAR